VAGTFDLLHPGHVLYLKQAWELGRVIAVVSRDSTVERIKRRRPIIPEEQRAFMVGSIEYVERSRVGYEGDMFRVVEEEAPDIILLGPNQPFDEVQVMHELEKRGIRARVLRAREEATLRVMQHTRIYREFYPSIILLHSITTGGQLSIYLASLLIIPWLLFTYIRRIVT